MTKLINLTPHPIVLMDTNGQVVETIESTGFARAKQENTSIGSVNGFPLSQVRFGEPEGMPAPQDGVLFVVSQITANALKDQGRTEDILIVDQAVRDDQGRIIGCRGFAKV